MVYPLDQVSIRFYPETLVIASYLRVFLQSVPQKVAWNTLAILAQKYGFPTQSQKLCIRCIQFFPAALS